MPLLSVQGGFSRNGERGGGREKKQNLLRILGETKTNTKQPRSKEREGTLVMQDREKRGERGGEGRLWENNNRESFLKNLPRAYLP